MKILVGTADRALREQIVRGLARFAFDVQAVDDGLSTFQWILREEFDLALLDHELPPSTAPDLLRRAGSLDRRALPPTIVFTRTAAQQEEIRASDLPRTDAVPIPTPTRNLVDRVLRLLRGRTRVVCVGGGTGLFTLLRGLRTLPDLSLTSVVSMSDDGGSTGRLRDGFGILPPGDVRRSLIALSSAPELLNEMMGYRFVRGGELSGHNLGNLMLTALSEMRGGMSAAVRALGSILGIQGRVVPVTEENVSLVAELEDGTEIRGETRIDLLPPAGPGRRIRRLRCDPEGGISAAAGRAFAEADVLLLGPGDLYTSIVANLVVGGVAEAVAKSPARRIHLLNVMTKPGETAGFSARDHVRELLRYLPGDCLDDVVVSTTAFSPEALGQYAKEGQEPVVERAGETLEDVTRARVFRADVASDSVLVRHDSLKLATAIRDLLSAEPSASNPVDG